MYWINRKAAKEVLRNPFNSKELIKPSMANKIFVDINKEYVKDFDNKWVRGSIPMNYFISKFVEMTGSNSADLEKEFVDYFGKNEIEDLVNENKEKENEK